MTNYVIFLVITPILVTLYFLQALYGALALSDLFEANFVNENYVIFKKYIPPVAYAVVGSIGIYSMKTSRVWPMYFTLFGILVLFFSEIAQTLGSFKPAYLFESESDLETIPNYCNFFTDSGAEQLLHQRCKRALNLGYIIVFLLAFQSLVLYKTIVDVELEQRRPQLQFVNKPECLA